MEQKFKNGDLVRLISEGPIMTVASFIENEEAYQCVWFARTKSTGAEQLFNNLFPEHVLSAITTIPFEAQRQLPL